VTAAAVRRRQEGHLVSNQFGGTLVRIDPRTNQADRARAVRPHREGRDGAGHPRAIFKRAIERGNVVVAEATKREVGRLSLEGRRSPLG
jgi:hypothetical protein